MIFCSSLLAVIRKNNQVQVFQISLNLCFFNKCVLSALRVPGPGLALGSRKKPGGCRLGEGEGNATAILWT